MTRRGNQADPPPPPDPTMAQLLRMMMEDRDFSRLERQTSMTTMQQLVELVNNNNNNNGNQNHDHGEEGQRSKLKDFQATNPPIFARAVQPLDADDWLLTIENNLVVAGVGANEKVLYTTHYLSGPARSWWESIKAMQPPGQAINWAEFKIKFRKAYVPAGMIKRKKDEFRKLRQGAMSVSEYRNKFIELSRYAPEDTDTEEKKMERFLDGLHDEMQYVLVAMPFTDLESLADSALLMEGKHNNAVESKKRRLMNQGNGSSQHQKPRTNPPPRPAHPPQRAHAYASAPRPNYPTRTGGNPKFGGKTSYPNNINLSAITCFECGLKGHYSNACPKKQNGTQRPNAPGPNPVNGNHNKNPVPKLPMTSAKGKFNHMSAEEAQESPDVVLGTFLVNSVHAHVLFDSRASHSFVTQDFVKKSHMNPTMMWGSYGSF